LLQLHERSKSSAEVLRVRAFNCHSLFRRFEFVSEFSHRYRCDYWPAINRVFAARSAASSAAAFPARLTNDGSARSIAAGSLAKHQQGEFMKYILLIVTLAAFIGTASATSPSASGCCSGGKCCKSACCKH
jgi:hypothetical protein